VESRDAIFLDQHTPLRAKRARVELLTTPYEPQMDTSGVNSMVRKIIPRKETHTKLPTLTYLGEVGGIHMHHHI
jgi:hypothetical protein